MNALTALPIDLAATLDAIGSALIGSLWQISVVGLIYLLAKRIWRKPAARHLLGTACLLAATTWPAANFVSELSRPPSQPRSLAQVEMSPASQTIATDAAQSPGQLARQDRSQGSTAALVRISSACLWLIGASLMVGRLVLGLLHLRRLQRPPIAEAFVHATRRLEHRLATLAQSVGLAARHHRIRLRVVGQQLGPCTFGLLRATVLVPMSACTGLPAAQLDAILLHELAHIRRHDAWFATLQAVLDCVLFFHPVARWISRDTTLAREQACDDLVINAEPLTDRTNYAEALLGLAHLRQIHPSSAAQGSRLQARVRRILNLKPSETAMSSQLPSIALPLTAIALLGLLATVTPALEPQQVVADIPAQITISAEVVSLSNSVLDDFGFHLSQGLDSNLKYAILTSGQPERLREHILETISAPTILTAVGSRAEVQTGIEDPTNSTEFRREDGLPTNARLDLSILPLRAVDGLMIADLTFALHPAVGTIRRSYADRGFEVNLRDFVVQEAAPLLLVEAADPAENRPLIGLILNIDLEPQTNSLTDLSDSSRATVSVLDADLLEALKTMSRVAQLDLLIDATADSLLNAPLTLQAVAVPVQQLISAILDLSCLEGTFAEETLEIYPKPGCVQGDKTEIERERR